MNTNYAAPLKMSESTKNRFELLRDTIDFKINTILDIGAHEGFWAMDFKEIFSESNIFMIEGDCDKKQILEQTEIPYEISLLSDEVKEVVFYKYIGKYTTGNSIYKENTLTFNNNHEKVIKTTNTLRNVVNKRGITGIDMIKLDVQGSEKDIIMGGLEIFSKCKIICIEMSIVNYNINSPTNFEVFSLLNTLGFKLHDIIGLHYSPPQLEQFDAIFIKTGKI